MSNTLAIIPTHLSERIDLVATLKAVTTLTNTTDNDVDILVVDDCSPNKELRRELEKALDIVEVGFVASEEHQGFSSTINIGLRKARDSGQDALLVNADMEFSDNGWFQAMSARDEAVVGTLLLYPNGLIAHAGVFYSVITRHYGHIYRGAPGNLANAQAERICPVTAALMLIKNQALREIGIFDYQLRMGFEDISYCHQVFQGGMQCIYEPKAVAIHHESLFRTKSRRSAKIDGWMKESWAYLHEKHAGSDFSYIPTLLLEEELQ